MPGFLKQRWFLALIVAVLVSLILWFAGPYVAFADVRPLESVVGRLIGVLVVVVICAVWLQIGSMRAQNSNKQLASAVTGQADGPASGAARESADAKQLRERFAEAVDALRKSKRGGASLYDLPWYVIVGPPGSGKTTALVNSGLRFPLSQKFGAGALRGVGGTRNCDWWFTDQAVLLDTAGRYMTQDSDASADSAGWAEFLKLLKRYRGRRPINGVLVAMSASDLMLLDDRARGGHVAAVRRRLEELNHNLRIRLPVYLLITKCDLIAGFTEFFDDLAQDGRAQVWGATFAIEASERGEAPKSFAAEFDALMARLQEKLIGRLEADRDPRRRAAMLAFPQQLGSLKGTLTAFVNEAFSSTGYDSDVLLRGVYFTSGTQESTPIDRMMGAIARTFGLDNQVVAPPPAGRSYFIEKLLKDVVIAEAGLAGVNRRLEYRLLALQYAGYVACALITILGLSAMFVSFSANGSYLDEVGAAIGAYQQTPAPAAPVTAETLGDTLPRLGALRNVVDTAERYRDARPLRMRWGLYQGNAVGDAARDAYIRELSGSLLPALGDRFRAGVLATTAQPDRLYEYLKAYLMLSDPKRLDADQIGFLANLEWRRLFPSQPDIRDQLQAHFGALLQDKDRLRPLTADNDLVQRARDSLRAASLPLLMYSRLKLAYAGDKKRAFRIDTAAGLGADKVFVRVSGAKLSEPVSAVYTKAVFDEFQRTGKMSLIKQFADDRWVLGDAAPSLQDMSHMTYDVTQLYEADYIATWDALLADVRVRPTTDSRDLADLLRLLASPASPLKGFYLAVDKQTNLLKKDDNPLGTKADAALSGLASKAGQLSQVFGGDAASTDPNDVPGAKVTAHFDPFHKLVDASGGAAPIDRLLAGFGQAQQALDRVNQGGGGAGGAAQAGQSDAFQALKSEAALLPPAIGDLVGQIGQRSETVVTDQARSELGRQYQEQVVRACREVVAGRYPFESGSAIDVPLADFGRIFGYGGVYDSFFTTTLQPLVDTSRSPWTWREGAGAATAIPGLLERFQAAQRIRDNFFKPGGQQPEVRFTLAPDSLDSDSNRFVLELDGQQLEYRHGPARTTAMSWPGGPGGQAAVTFESGAGAGANLPFQGPWAWFRLLEHAQIQGQSDVRYLLSFSAGGHSARLVLEATSIRNPFAHPELLRFKCN
ncbi:MAG TPA: type VI secretion system membrane subunit TssM [Steroidobacteraceae bacterium]|nr:type VI secretion system membrane subunit TssM [Steroidobacteraceae bacterium]